jgi:hypothetical protein
MVEFSWKAQRGDSDEEDEIWRGADQGHFARG